MTNSRRIFCKNSVLLGLGLSFSPLITTAKTNKKVLSLRKKAEKAVNVYGKICYEDLSPVGNAAIEIWHNNSESNQNHFEYTGRLKADALGNYQFETDFPERHFEEGYYKMRRIFFKITDSSGKETLTKLYFGMDDKAFINCTHFRSTPEKYRLELPKTKLENKNLSIVQFNIYLNS